MRIAMLFLLAGCIPDFQLATRTFADTGSEPLADASDPLDASDPADVAIEDRGSMDAMTIDADPMDAQAIDADPMDAEVIDGDPIDADPIDADPIDANPDALVDGGWENCENDTDDDGDLQADCADPDCDLHTNASMTWQCRGLLKHEANCTNNLDDDGDGDFDCHDDPDCGCGPLGLFCCPNGRCADLIVNC